MLTPAHLYQSEKPCILWTVDVEDYYMSPESIPVSSWDKGLFEDRIHIGCNRLLEVFSEGGIKATWFFLGWIAEKHPELVQTVHRQGHEIGTHTWDHRPVYSLSAEEYRLSLERSCALLESLTGEKVFGHRAPEWSLRRDMDWAQNILSELGFLYDSSINPISTYLYGDQGAPRHAYRLSAQPSLWEIPPAAIRLGGITLSVGGGFFLRAFPVFYMKRAIQKYNREGSPAVVYLHPWELDTQHPIPSMSFKESWIHRWGLKGVERKARALCSMFDSMRMVDYARQLKEKKQQQG